MRAVEILMQEHRLIERVLDALEIAASHLDRGRTVRPGFFTDATEFIAGYADGTHHRKEEGVLFDAMIASGEPKDGAIAVMLDEHEQGRALTRAMRDGVKRLEGGDAAAGRRIAASARSYVALLRDHIAKEDEMLFPEADGMLSPERHDAVLAGFEAIERQDAAEGARERFTALAERLEAEARALSAA